MKTATKTAPTGIPTSVAERAAATRRQADQAEQRAVAAATERASLTTRLQAVERRGQELADQAQSLETERTGVEQALADAQLLVEIGAPAPQTHDHEERRQELDRLLRERAAERAQIETLRSGLQERITALQTTERAEVARAEQLRREALVDERTALVQRIHRARLAFLAAVVDAGLWNAQQGLLTLSPAEIQRNGYGPISTAADAIDSGTQALVTLLRGRSDLGPEWIVRQAQQFGIAPQDVG